MKSIIAQLLIISLTLTSCSGGTGGSNQQNNTPVFNLSGTVTSISHFIFSEAMADSSIPNCLSTCDKQTQKCATLSLVTTTSTNDIILCDTELDSNGHFNFAITNQSALKNFMTKITIDNFNGSKREILEYVNSDNDPSVNLDVNPSTTASVNIVKDGYLNDPESVKNNSSDNGKQLQNDLINMCPGKITSENVLDLIKNNLNSFSDSTNSELIILFHKRMANQDSLTDIQSSIDQLCILISQNATVSFNHPLKLSSQREVSGANIGSKIFFPYGSSPDYSSAPVEIFDTATGEYRSEPIPNPIGQSAIATIGDNLFLIGGYEYIGIPSPGQVNAGQKTYGVSSKINIYNSVTHTWSSQLLSTPRLGMQVAVIGTKLLVPGGWSGGRGDTFLSDIEIIDTASWTKTTKTLSVGRIGAASAVVGTKAYFIGGIHSYDSSGNTSNIVDGTIDIYDSNSDSISTITMPRKRAYAATVVVGTKIYIGAGSNQDDSIQGIVDILDTTDNTWTSAKIADHGNGAVAGIVGKYVFFAGSGTGAYATNTANIISILDTTTGGWSEGRMSLSRYNMGLAIANGKAYFAGGDPLAGGNTDVIEVFDSISKTISVGK